jgi:hypothetical protein
LRAPSVFNFFRPGYVPPNTTLSELSLVAPEFQIANETSVAGYANYMRSVVSGGVGTTPPGSTDRDVQLDLSELLALSDQPARLVDQVGMLLTAGRLGGVVRDQVITAVTSVSVTSSTNPATIAAARRNRVMLALYLVAMSPEFLVVK